MSFGTGQSATTTPPDGSSSSPEDARSTGDGDAATSLDRECTQAFLCERFDDDAIVNRGWTRDNALISSAKVFRASVAAGSRSISEITHPINARPNARRIQIGLTLQIIEGRNRNVDIVNYRRRNGETTGVFISANGNNNGDIEFGFYEASSNTLQSESIGIRFERPTRMMLVIDYGTGEASLSAEGMSAPRTFPLPQGLPTVGAASLILGYSFIDNGSPTDQQHALEMDDVILSDL